jgi:hypothetical protein
MFGLRAISSKSFIRRASAANSKPKSENKSFAAFVAKFAPLENASVMLLTDNRTGALYCECHIKGSLIVSLGTTDVPPDPDEQSEYRANREIVENAPAFARMIEDAKLGRSFSNIVAEYSTEYDEEHPLKIIGGQHRYQAIKTAFEESKDEHHGVKVYFDLTMDQRLDVQLISNTNIAISGDLFDRMHETVMGPELRNWCSPTGLRRPRPSARPQAAVLTADQTAGDLLRQVFQRQTFVVR